MLRQHADELAFVQGFTKRGCSRPASSARLTSSAKALAGPRNDGDGPACGWRLRGWPLCRGNVVHYRYHQIHQNRIKRPGTVTAADPTCSTACLPLPRQRQPRPSSLFQHIAGHLGIQGVVAAGSRRIPFRLAAFAGLPAFRARSDPAQKGSSTHCKGRALPILLCNVTVPPIRSGPASR